VERAVAALAAHNDRGKVLLDSALVAAAHLARLRLDVFAVETAGTDDTPGTKKQ
jgi:hypothetical protein